MREANWDAMFQRRAAPADAETRLNSIIPWEDWLTFFIATVAFLSVVQSIDSANWVDDMPSLYPIGFAGLLMGYLFSRIRWNALFVLPIALLAGLTLVYFQIIAAVPGGSLAIRSDHLVDRMHIWWSAVTQNGISSDSLPFIVLTLALVWSGTFFSSWAIFRWRNAWAGIVPGGIALMWNISFLPGQFSYAFVVYVFAAVLLVMRLHLARKQDEWDRSGVAYPEFMSISVLNATFWVTLALLAAVWLLPLANRSDTASQRWHDFTAPYTQRLAPLARVFVGLNAKKPIDVHNLKDALALQGAIRLSGKQALELNVKLTPEMAAYLRAQSFDEYTSNGWKVNVDGDIQLPANTQTNVAAGADAGARQQLTLHVKVEGGDNGAIYSLGQPLASSEASKARTGGDNRDVSGLQPSGHLRDGDIYAVTGSVNVASVQRLENAGTAYPAWVTNRYLSVPDNLPERVRGKAQEVTGNATTAYDKAAAIERYLRTFPVDYTVTKAPSGQDSVDYFLFDAQRGYFDYYASAMAVMLRTLGIPARVATGYVIDPAAKADGSDDYQITEKNAFTWPEVYFPGIGWVEFNPSPSEPLINRPGTPPLISRANTSARGALDPIDLGAIVGDPALGSGAAPTPPATNADGNGSSGGGIPGWLPFAMVGVLAVVIVGGGALAWEAGLSDLSDAGKVWRKTQRLARWSRLGTPPAETPREFAARLRAHVVGVDEVAYLAERYERSTFGRKPASEDERERLMASWLAVRNRLLALMIGRR